MLFLLKKLAISLLVSSFFIMMQAQAGIVEPVYKQLKDPGTDNAPSTVSLSITPNGKKCLYWITLKMQALKKFIFMI